jgi:hypothetical protein
MLALRGVYDGKTIRLLPSETAPQVQGETPVAVIFLLEDIAYLGKSPEAPAKIPASVAAQQLDALRAKLGPIGVSVKDLIDEGRYR